MDRTNSPIGVFDSGVGGISVLGCLWKLMPDENYVYFGDSKNAPYGTRPEEEIKEFTNQSIKKLINMDVKAVVIACNTATSVAVKDLRAQYDVPIIGIEPAVKPAATSHKGGRVLVMATPMTLIKEKFNSLMASYSDISQIIPLPCPNLVEIIERGVISGIEVDNYLKKLFEPFKNQKINAVVLGCTHYPFIRKSIENYFSYPVDIIDGGYGTAKETRRRLGEAGLLNRNTGNGSIEFISSKCDNKEISLMKKLFNYAKQTAQ